jgi:dTDP-4-amino-4,6-dideoxygalactose transaminase/nucleoside-diphosphate-sugar epimerase
MRWVVVGGGGFIGRTLCRRLHAAGADVVAVDAVEAEAPWPTVRADLLVDPIALPAGRIVLVVGTSMMRPLRTWTLALDNAVATARIAPQLRDRDVTLVSTIEVYGSAPAPLTEETEPELPAAPAELEPWVERAVAAAAAPCPPHRAVGLCRELAALDPSGRWVYALTKVAQELIVRRFVEPERLTVLRLANVVGPGQFRVVGRLVEAVQSGRACVVTDTLRSFVSVDEVARAAHLVTTPGTVNVSSAVIHLSDVAAIVGDELGREPIVRIAPPPLSDSCGVVDSARLRGLLDGLEGVEDGLRTAIRSLAADPGPMFRPPLAVVVPPRPEQPDVVADRIAAGLWTGQVRGGQWSAELTETLRSHLGLDDDRRLILTNSGTNALRLAVNALAGTARPGDVALCPAFTFHATPEVLRQLGFTVRFVDVDPATWTIDPDALAAALRDDAVRVAVCVDALGNPCEYVALTALCDRAGVPLVADSAAALGARHDDRPVAMQARAHAFSMSFAKVVSGGGSGGAVVLPAAADLSPAENWLRSAAMTEASAAVALDGVTVLEELAARRCLVAEIYDEAFAGAADLTGQLVRPGDRHAWVHWVTRVDRVVGRDRLAAALAGEGVQTKPYYEPLLGVPGPEAVPVTRRLHEEALALPMSSELSRDDAERVAAATLRALRRLRPVEPADPVDAAGREPEPASLGAA